MRRCASDAQKLEQLRRLIREIEYLKYTLNSTLYWDKMTYMPEKGLTYRSEVMSFLGAQLYERFRSPELRSLVDHFSRLIKLNEQDKKRNSELISTLECYLSNKQSIRKTSELMNVHPRTVSYRLSKIVDLTGIEFDNSAEILAVRNGIIILKIIEQL